MTSDEIQRTIEFILKHEADAAVRIANFEINVKELEINVKETDRVVRNLAASTDRFQEYVKDVLKVLVPILEIQSRRLDRLEGQA